MSNCNVFPPNTVVLDIIHGLENGFQIKYMKIWKGFACSYKEFINSMSNPLLVLRFNQLVMM